MPLRRRIVALAVGAFAFIVPALQASPAQAFTGTARGRVFEPNPVVTLRDETLTDQKDADYAALQPAYEIVTLLRLDGSGNLRATGHVLKTRRTERGFSPRSANRAVSSY